jgi:hypothetical protein
VLACLAKDPTDRPPSAAAVAAALDAVEVVDWSQSDASAWWARYGTPGDAVEVSDGMLAATGGQP